MYNHTFQDSTWAPLNPETVSIDFRVEIWIRAIRSQGKHIISILNARRPKQIKTRVVSHLIIL